MSNRIGRPSQASLYTHVMRYCDSLGCKNDRYHRCRGHREPHKDVVAVVSKP